MSVIYINSYQFASAAALWTPAQLTTALWLDAADAATITQSSGLVSQWSDKSSNSRHATQSTGSLQPSYVSAALNGQNALLFSANYLNIAAFGTATYSWFVALGQNTATLRSVFGSSDSYVPIGRVDTANTILRINNVNNPAGAYQIYNGESTQTVVQRTDCHTKLGQSTGVIAGYVNIPVISATINLGFATNSYGHNGYMGEVIVVNGTPSLSDIQKIQGYLAHKWGLTAILPADHPYKSAAPTV